MFGSVVSLGQVLGVLGRSTFLPISRSTIFGPGTLRLRTGFSAGFGITGSGGCGSGSRDARPWLRAWAGGGGRLLGPFGQLRCFRRLAGLRRFFNGWQVGRQLVVLDGLKLSPTSSAAGFPHQNTHATSGTSTCACRKMDSSSPRPIRPRSRRVCCPAICGAEVTRTRRWIHGDCGSWSSRTRYRLENRSAHQGISGAIDEQAPGENTRG